MRLAVKFWPPFPPSERLCLRMSVPLWNQPVQFWNDRQTAGLTEGSYLEHRCPLSSTRSTNVYEAAAVRGFDSARRRASCCLPARASSDASPSMKRVQK